MRGSARSVAGIHIRDVLDGIATRHPGLIEKFGGHAMAAGMSLPEANLEPFRAAFAAHAAAVVIKRLVRRPRPHHPAVAVNVGTPSSLSFPSAHATSM